MPTIYSKLVCGYVLPAVLSLGVCSAQADPKADVNANVKADVKADAQAKVQAEPAKVSETELAEYRARVALEQAHKDIIHRWLSELWDQAHYSVAAELLTADFKRHSESEGYAAEGPEAYAAIIKSCHDGFPDSRITLVDMIAENDKVFVRWHWTGTHTAEFRGIPASGKAISVYGEDLIHFRDGKISGIWPLFDPLRLMLQIGAIEQVNPQ